MTETLDDLLFGAIAIGTFLGFKMPDEVDKVYRLADRKIIPVGRVGGPRGKMIGSKRRIAAALDKIASGEPVWATGYPDGRAIGAACAALRQISAPRRIFGLSTVVGIQSETDPPRIVIRMWTAAGASSCIPTSADLPPDLVFEEWRGVAKIIRDIAILTPVDKLGREEREETDKAIGGSSRFLASLDPCRPRRARLMRAQNFLRRTIGGLITQEYS